MLSGETDEGQLFGKQSSAIHSGTLNDARVDGWIAGGRGTDL